MHRESASSGAYRSSRRRSLPRVLCAAPLAGGALLLTACANLAGPAYSRPEAPVKAAWSQQATPVPSAAQTIEPDWWKRFGDPYLDGLIDQAISNNIDIAILAARSGVAKATISQARAGLLPTLTAGAGTDTFHTTGSSTSTQYSTAGQASWEIDIWGKVRKGVEAQKAEYRATESDWRAGYLTMVSDVATTYFQIRQFDEQLAQQRRTIERNDTILNIFRSMLKEGLVPKTQVLQQEAELNRLQNQYLEFQRLRTLAQNGLATLLGIPAADLKVPPAPEVETVRVVPVPAGLPSDLLTRRPDIVAAEYRVLEAYHLQGQARLARLPSISLTGQAGSASFALTDLLKSWTFGLSSLVSFPIFDPNINARIKVSDAQTKVASEEYRRTVIGAFEEVENALTNLASHKAQRSELEQRRERLNTVAEQVHAQLAEGMVSQLEVFEAERTLLDAQQSLLANQWQIVSDTVALYKALGGGWPQEVVADTAR